MPLLQCLNALQSQSSFSHSKVDMIVRERERESWTTVADDEGKSERGF